MEQKNLDFVKKYYSDPKIKELILSQSQNYSYCVGTGVTLLEQGWTFPIKEVGISQIEELLNEGLDISFPIRCKDDNYLYIVWDIKYFNTENPNWIFDRVNQKKIFELGSPIFEAVEETLDSFGIKYLVDITVSGIHVWSKIKVSSEAFCKFASESNLFPSLEQKYTQIIPEDKKRTRPVSLDLGRAYNTAGKILEYFSHILIDKSKEFKIPITVSGAASFSKNFSFSGISSDLSQYSHPIYMRCMRAFCSLHQKSVMNGFSELGSAVNIIKTKEISYVDSLEIMWNVDKALNFYNKNFKKKKIDVPDSSQGWLEAFNSYTKSELRKKHKIWERIPATKKDCDLTQPDVKKFFEPANANPALLIPSNLQIIVNHFASSGVSAVKKVFSIIAKYYADKMLGWYDYLKFTGINWDKYDPETVSDFWGRIYWSLNIPSVPKNVQNVPKSSKSQKKQKKQKRKNGK
ncbi:MAG: hypothetical protein ABID79_00750 [Elusimicrobiota bacterium]